jgi:hypothetical protein
MKTIFTPLSMKIPSPNIFSLSFNRERQRQVRKWQQQQRGRQNYKPMLVK